VTPSSRSPGRLTARNYVIRSVQRHTNEIAMVSLQEGSIRVLKSLEWQQGPIKTSLSPDGRYIAYDAPAGASPRDIFVLAVD
jgi:hypothetical protein